MIEVSIRPNGHEGYNVEVQAPHLGPARVPVKVFKPADDSRGHRFAVAHARAQAQAYCEGFREALAVTGDYLTSLKTR